MTEKRTKHLVKPSEPVLVLRTCAPDMTSSHGFAWPKEGPVSAPDWKPTLECGNGLHGLLWGAGDGSLLNWDDAAVWLVVEVKEYVDLNGKIKFPEGVVLFCGNRQSAVEFIGARAPLNTPIVDLTVTAGDYGTATAGHYSTATAGYRGTATAGDRSTATAGHYGTVIAGDYGTATAGHRSTATAGDYGTATAGDRGTATAGYAGTATVGNVGTATAGNVGTATAGDYGTATAGYRGTATAGHYGTVIAGDYGTATAGYRGTATAGHDGTATAGERGMILVQWHDGRRYRVAVGYVGENGIEPNTAYRYDPEKGWQKVD